MNLTTSLTSRPALSTIVLTANAQETSQMLDELLVISESEKPIWVPTAVALPSQWFSESKHLGLDDNRHLMYGLNRGERYLFSAISAIGITLLASLLIWLI